MEISEQNKVIDGIVYRPSWRATFQALPIGGKIKLNRTQLTYQVACSSIKWIKDRYKGYDFTITPVDRFKDDFVVERIA